MSEKEPPKVVTLYYRPSTERVSTTIQLSPIGADGFAPVRYVGESAIRAVIEEVQKQADYWHNRDPLTVTQMEWVIGMLEALLAEPSVLE